MKTKEYWETVKYFSPNENWGDVERIDPSLILELDRFRHKVATPIIITCGTQGKHIDGSFHYLGLALDIMFPEKEKKDIPDLFLQALKFQFRGIGIYPDWKYKDKVIGGMHVDYRPIKAYPEPKATWIGVSKSYLAADMSNLYHLFYKTNAQI